MGIVKHKMLIHIKFHYLTYFTNKNISFFSYKKYATLFHVVQPNSSYNVLHAVLL